MAQAAASAMLQRFEGVERVIQENLDRAADVAAAAYSHVRCNEKEWRKRAEKDAENQRRAQEEEEEKIRQQKKLNFLLTQTELYSHFMSKKMGVQAEGSAGGSAKLPQSSLQRSVVELGAPAREEASELERAQTAALRACKEHISKIEKFDAESRHLRNPQSSAASAGQSNGAGASTAVIGHRRVGGHVTNSSSIQPPSSGAALAQDGMVEQPRNLRGQLKSYQLKGLNWLINLHEQGINGILADEMGLGKTVQTISLLVHLAEAKGIWGPFIVIAPTSTLPNWANEIRKFCPSFNVLPYWGSLKQRSVLRKVLHSRYLHRADSIAHVVVTSYQLIVQDEKFFHRIHWEYMILDEAHAIKSSTSVRWNTLLSFKNTRNRLLLTGTPIQNNMAELWALLHFIMPTLFDSHDEFYEWFSKDIEEHAQGTKSVLNEHQLNRLHMILKPFMLRRVKHEVENEMPPKQEIHIKCNMTPRQIQLYNGIKNRLSVSELLNKVNTIKMNKSAQERHAKHLMNIVMQFRNICNHPEILERSETVSPLQFTAAVPPTLSYNSIIAPVLKNHVEMSIPRLIYREAMDNLSFSFSGGALQGARTKWLYHRLNVFSQEHVRQSNSCASSPRSRCWDFLSLCDWSAGEVEWLYHHDLWHRWQLQLSKQRRGLALSRPYHPLHAKQLDFVRVRGATSWPSVRTSLALSDMVRTPLDRLHGLLGAARASYAAHRTLVWAPPIELCCFDRRYASQLDAHASDPRVWKLLLGSSRWLRNSPPESPVESSAPSCVELDWPERPLLRPLLDAFGSTQIFVPQFSELVRDCGKLKVLDNLLKQLKADNHRVLVYSQFTEVLDILEDFLYVRSYKFVRLDGSRKLDDRRNMVEQFQTDPTIFIFLLSTRAGGLGINLTAADTVIFYDSDWNPTIDAQAMDRAHRLGQTKPVTVYRLITRDSVEEHMLLRAKQKGTIQNLVIKGGHFEMASDETEESPKASEMINWILSKADLDDSGTGSDAKKRPLSALKYGLKPRSSIPSRRSTKLVATSIFPETPIDLKSS
ncbi:chromatin-remodeling ATPase INO80-like [Schistocerca gregaria]|uniref:chromatin-remodeling ATPase INO80-like n=1 Tax=Schistocerca gregaria TaxID=7010 RepID=UPI00211F3907|nr:chromatin-remodeling ATPase INO80-like [Schistocerca gregaria]